MKQLEGVGMTHESEEQEATLGQRIKAKRLALGWTQARLAEEVGAATLSVIRWERGTFYPRDDDVQLALIEVLGLPKNEFEKGKRKLTKKQEEAARIEEVKEQKGERVSQELREDEGFLPIKMILPYHYWNVSLPSPEEVEAMEFVEYRATPIIVYRGFHEQVYYEKYGYSEERRVTSNGRKLLPYSRYINPDTVIYGWGHTGMGPRNLAESILFDYFKIMYLSEEEEVLRSWVNKYSFNFKMDFTAWFDKREWKVWSGAITMWLKEQRENGDPAPENTLDDVKYGWTGWWKRWDTYKGM